MLFCGDQVRARLRGSGRLVRSVRAFVSNRPVTAGVLIAFCAWAGFAGPAIAAEPGTISTVVGDGAPGYSGDGLPAVRAELKYPDTLTTTPAGDLVIADTSNGVVRLVAAASCASDCAYGLPSTIKGDIYTVAGNSGFANENGEYSGPATQAGLSLPESVAVDQDGDIVIADTFNSTVRLVARSNCASGCPFGLASMTRGYIYTIAGDGRDGTRGDGGPATSAELGAPDAVAVDAQGNLAIGDGIYSVVRVVAASDCAEDCPYGLSSTNKGDIYLVAGAGSHGLSGDGVRATDSNIGTADGLAFDGVGDLLIGDYDNRVYLVAGSSCAYDCQYGLRSMAPGDIYTVAGGGSYFRPGDGGPADLASLYTPRAVALDGAGDLVIDDSGNGRVRIVPDIGCSTYCAFGPSTSWKGKGFIYTIAGNGAFAFGGDGGPATSAELSQPLGLTIDGNGNLLIADTFNGRIRMVTGADPPPVCYETGAREVGADGFTGTRDQEGVIVYAPAGLESITDVTVVNGTAIHPAFTEATKGPVVVTATKATQGQPLSGYYKATDEAGRSTYCGFHLAA